MSCNQAAGLAASRGAIVLGTGGFTYDRFVSEDRFCLRSETTDPAWVPAGDTPSALWDIAAWNGRWNFGELLTAAGMAERPEHNPYGSERTRQRAITKRLVIAIAILAGVVLALLLRRYLG